MEKRTSEEIKEQSMARFFDLAANKYDKGQEEHGGLLDETVTIEKVEEELIDGWFYIQSLRRKTKNEVNRKARALHEKDRIMDGLQSRVFELKDELERVKVANAAYEKEIERWKEAAKR